jgi:CubicO group peptidase (beta-lactamase class C family)
MLELNGPGGAKRLRVLLDREEQKIADFELLAPPPSLKLSLATLLDTFDSLATEGLSGLFFYKLKGEVILKKPFGMANRGLHLPNTENIIFGTGSRPIDYTVAAIQLLDQQGKLSLDDPITKFIDEVPDDKTPITIRHLMTGQSGLPDFFDNDEDWDPDLAWVDRHTAMQRMMNQKLLFKPGTADEHSHGAFGLLAAIIETVSNQAYYAFLREHFFDPAGMDRTGEYGEVRDLQVADFAVGGGPQKIGLPNIPPNWGPTSWLIKGSGGMYSTLGDLQKFYSYLRSGKVLDESHQRPFRQATVNLDGSMRGFELFSAYLPPDTELYLFLNETGDRSQLRALFRGLEALLPKDD